jgi:hypothetical protein
MLLGLDRLSATTRIEGPVLRSKRLLTGCDF